MLGFGGQTQELCETGGNRDHTLRVAQEVPHSLGPRAKAVISQEPGPELPASLGGLLGRRGAAVAHPGGVDMVADIGGVHLNELSFGEADILLAH